MNATLSQLVQIPADTGFLEGMLELPPNARGVVLFAHGSGSSRLSPRNNFVAEKLLDARLRIQQIIALRFGLDDGRQRTLEEVGRQFGVTRERIRQIEAKALRKLRHPSRSKRLKDYVR